MDIGTTRSVFLLVFWAGKNSSAFGWNRTCDH